MIEILKMFGTMIGVYVLVFIFGPPIVYMFARAFSAGFEKGRSLVISKESQKPTDSSEGL